MLRRIAILAHRDLRSYLSSRVTLFFLLAVPIVMTVGLGLLFPGGAAPSADPLLLVDDDNTATSRALIRLLRAAFEPRVLEPWPELAAAQARVATASEGAVIHIPAGYEGVVQGDAPVAWSGVAVLGLPDDVRLGAVPPVVRLAQARLARAAARARQGAEAREGAREEAIAVALAGLPGPPLVRVRASRPIEPEAAAGTGFLQSSPGMLVMMGLLIVIPAATSLVADRVDGRLRRLLVAPLRRGEILAGKGLGLFCLLAVQQVALIAFGQLFLDLGWTGSPAALALLIGSYGFFCTSMGMLIAALARTSGQAFAITLLIGNTLPPLSGAWFPLEITSEGFRSVARWLPTAWAMQAFQGVVAYGRTLGEVVPTAAALMLVGVVAGAAAVWRFRFE